MPGDSLERVAYHYGLNGLLDAILDALSATGKDIDRLVPADLAAVDEFHIRGREATLELAARADIEAGMINGFAIDQVFLLATTIYVAIPSVMVLATLVLRPHASRIANIALGVPIALTIVVGAIGQWGYYIFGSALEVACLAGIVYYAWTWPRSAELASGLPRDPAAREAATA